jgi:DNA-directed RNA polymerase subunit K/omega
MSGKYEESSDSEYDDDDDDNNVVQPHSNNKVVQPKQNALSESEDSDNDEEKSMVDDEDDENDYLSDNDDEDDDPDKSKQIFKNTHIGNQDQELYGLSGGESDDENDDDEDEDENYLQKFDESLKQNIISEYHPEMQQLSYSEVEVLTAIKRNDVGEIYDPLHRTIPFLTKFEKSRVLGERAKQINDGATPFIALKPNVIDGYLIALEELEQKAIPFIIKRPLPNGGCEYWKLKDLEVIV